MNKAVFLDRDGTINVEKNYLFEIEHFEFLPGVIEAMTMLQKAGYLLFIMTNQSGIARGFYTEDDFKKLTEWMLQELSAAGICIQEVYYCPHHPRAFVQKYKLKCNCRKPALGMYDKAIEKYNIDLSKSFAIGDKLRDCAISERSDCKSYWIADLQEASPHRNIKKVVTFVDAAEEILKLKGGQ